MTATISERIFKTLRNSISQVSDDALVQLKYFVNSQRTEEEAFMNKNMQPDLYYTMFGWILLYILNIKSDREKMKRYLNSHDISSLDLVHYSAYMRCQLIIDFMKGGIHGLMKNYLFSKPVKKPGEFRGMDNTDFNSPYQQYIYLSLLEDTGNNVKERNKLIKSLNQYKLDNGGYSNILNGKTASVNATAAALTVTGQLTGYKINHSIYYLRDQQEESGGFSANSAAPVADILSTATSLFVLKCYGLQAKKSPADFIEAHWLDSGGFSATLIEDCSDIEYTFYGLLALGAS